MALDQKIILLDAVTVTTDVDADNAGAAKGLKSRDRNFSFEIIAVKESGTGNLTVSIQHSFDGTNWYELVSNSSSVLSDTGNQLITPQVGSSEPLQWIRAVPSESATADYTVTVNALFNKRD